MLRIGYQTQEGIVKSARITERSRSGDISQKDKDKAMRTRMGAQVLHSFYQKLHQHWRLV